jgi:hypothetical protein
LLDNSNHFTNAQVNLSGGNVNTQFIIGGGYSRQDALFTGNYADQKVSFNGGLANTSVDQRLHTSFSIIYVNDNSNMPNQDPTQNIILPPDAPAIYDALGNLNWASYGGTATWQNPLAYTANHFKAISEFYSGNLAIEYSLFRRLNFKCSAGYSQQRMDQTNLTPSTYFPPPNSSNPIFRSSTFSLSSSRSWIVEPQLSYNQKSQKEHWKYYSEVLTRRAIVNLELSGAPAIPAMHCWKILWRLL